MLQIRRLAATVSVVVVVKEVREEYRYNRSQAGACRRLDACEHKNKIVRYQRDVIVGCDALRETLMVI
jgi:hypothetical protein